jgi:hypothetical protein
MSADKRKTILIVFAGLAVVLVAVIAVVSPTFRSEDASGAIGAVQKHRAPQITKADVILGDEQTRNEQRVQYVDFLHDAAALQNLSANFSTAARTRNTSDYDAVQLGIRAQSNEVFSRFKTEIIAVLIGTRTLAERDSAALGSRKTAVIAEIDSLGAKARSMSVANVAEVENLAAKLKDIENALGMKPTVNQRFLDAFKSQMESNNVAAARDTLKEFEASLGESADLAMQVRAKTEYLAAMAREAATLAEADSVLSTNNRERLGLMVVIANEAEALEARAAANMKASLDNAAETYEALGRMRQVVDSFNRDGSFSREAQNMDNRKAEAASRINAEAYSQLGALSAHLRAADAMGSKIRNEALDAQLGQLSRFSGNAAYASMIRNSDDFSMQVKALSNVSLNAAKKNIDSLNAQKKGAAATLDNQKK